MDKFIRNFHDALKVITFEIYNFKIFMSKKSGGDLAGSTVKGYKIIKMIG